MKASIISVTAAAATVSAGLFDNATVPWTTSTLTKSNVYTITSCAPTVTNCPARIGQVTTEIYLTTTFCPVSGGQTLLPLTTRPTAPVTTSTFYQTKEYTITSCAPTVTNCPVGSKTSSVLSFTTVIPPKGTFKPSGSVSRSSSRTKSSSAVTLPPGSSAISSSQSISKASSAVVPLPASTGKPTTPAVSIVTISSCVPSYITSIITVTATPSVSVSKASSVPASSAPSISVSKSSSVSVSTPAPAPPTKAVSVSASTVPSSTASKVPSGVAAPSGVASPSGFKPSASTKPTSGVASLTTTQPSKPAQFTGGASAQKAGGLVVAVGLAAALL